MSSDTIPQLTRLRRIDYYLATNARFYDAIPGTEDYVKKEDKIPFKKSVWRVTETIIKSGLDPCELKKDAVFQWAEHALFGAAQPSLAAPVQPVKVATEKAVDGKPKEDVVEEQTAVFNLPLGVTIYTLLLGACEIARMDTSPGRDERRQALENVSKMYLASVKAFVIPAPARQTEPEKPVTAVIKAAEPASTGAAPVLA